MSRARHRKSASPMKISGNPDVLKAAGADDYKSGGTVKRKARTRVAMEGNAVRQRADRPARGRLKRADGGPAALRRELAAGADAVRRGGLRGAFDYARSRAQERFPALFAARQQQPAAPA